MQPYSDGRWIRRAAAATDEALLRIDHRAIARRPCVDFAPPAPRRVEHLLQRRQPLREAAAGQPTDAAGGFVIVARPAVRCSLSAGLYARLTGSRQRYSVGEALHCR